jgi:hypothetical protein
MMLRELIGKLELEMWYYPCIYLKRCLPHDDALCGDDRLLRATEGEYPSIRAVLFLDRSIAATAVGHSCDESVKCVMSGWIVGRR